jgi:PAT family beta-lactamase induction signal transducer AmpG
MQDVGVDALAVDLLDEEERGRANGFMYASKWIGGIIGGAGLAHVMKWTSLRGALVVQVGLLAAIMTLPLFIRERPAGDEPTRPPVWSAITAWLRRVFGGRRVTTVLGEAARDRALQSALLGIVVMLISVAASVLLSAVNFGLYTRELHWDPGDYTNLQSYALALGAIGSALGGYFADRVGHRRLAGVAALALAAFYVVWSQLSPHWVDRSYVYATFWIEPLCVGTINAALFALCMDIAWPAIAASQFAVYMAMANVGSSFAYAHAGYATSTWDYPTIYLVAAAIQASLVLVLPLIDPRAARHSPRRQRPERRSSSPA